MIFYQSFICLYQNLLGRENIETFASQFGLLFADLMFKFGTGL